MAKAGLTTLEGEDYMRGKMFGFAEDYITGAGMTPFHPIRYGPRRIFEESRR